MKQYSEIGKLIKEGKTSNEIREQIIEFPYNPSVEYFMQLGYKKSTAKKYRRKLEKNNEKLEAEEFEFIISTNANSKKVILDTCALGYKRTINLVENAEEVTVLLATIREMDTHKDMKKAIETGNTYFAENMRRYSKKFLLEDKYRLVPFDGIKKNNYHDDIIIQYLLITPVKDRPTILTADANLADKAKCHGLEYILYNPKIFILKIPKDNNKKNQETKHEMEKTVQETSKITPEQKFQDKDEAKQLEKKKEQRSDKIVINGVVVQVKEENVKIKKYNNTAIVMQLMENGKYEEVFGDDIISTAKKFVILVSKRKTSSIDMTRVKIENATITEETDQYFYLNEIYAEQWITEEIAEIAKDLF